MDKNTALFARVSDGGSLPGDRVLSYKAACGTKCMTGEIAPNKVQQYEAGVKLRQGNVSTFVTAFKAKTNETNYDVTTGVSSANKYDAQGIELEMGYKSGGFRLNGGLTYTDAEVVGSNNASYVGKAPNRQAKFIYALSPSYRFTGWYNRIERCTNNIDRSRIASVPLHERLCEPRLEQVNCCVIGHQQLDQCDWLHRG